MELTLPDRRAYVGYLRPHASGDTGELWYEGFVRAVDCVGAARDERLNSDGAMPEVAPAPLVGLWPCQLKLNPAPPSRQDEIGGEYSPGRVCGGRRRTASVRSPT
jgi:hypothetical protein